MPKINLIKPDSIYMIRRKDMRDPEFFLYDLMYEGMPVVVRSTVLWTPDQWNAKEFYCEESVETFLVDCLKDRPCEIVMVK